MATRAETTQAAGEYRATVADCYGHAEVLTGQIDGDRMVFTSVGSPTVVIRPAWELVDDHTLLWRNEARVGDGPWSLVEDYRCRTEPCGDEARG